MVYYIYIIEMNKISARHRSNIQQSNASSARVLIRAIYSTRSRLRSRGGARWQLDLGGGAVRVSVALCAPPNGVITHINKHTYHRRLMAQVVWWCCCALMAATALLSQCDGIASDLATSAQHRCGDLQLSFANRSRDD